jgi:DNA-binding NarL/FixJ family response regulator
MMTAMPQRRRVALVSGDLMFQSQLDAALRRSGSELVPTTREGVAEVAAAVNAVFVDLNGDQPHRLGLIASLRSAHPGLQIVAFCHHEAHETRRMAMRVGASSCITNGALQTVALRLAGHAVPSGERVD